METNMPEKKTMDEGCKEHRETLQYIEERVRAIAAICFARDHKEGGAQAMLAVRHIEDARMRLGKVIQHTSGGGVSIYDKKE